MGGCCGIDPVGDLSDALSDLGDSISDNFSNLGNSISDAAKGFTEGVFNVLGVTDQDITVVQTFAVPLISEPQQFSRRTAVLKAILSNSSIPDFLLVNEQTSVRASADAYMRYGEDYFVNGLPSTSHATFPPESSRVANVLRQVAGVPCTPVSIELTNPTPFQWITWHLQNSYALNKTTKVMQLSGFPVTFTGEYILRTNGNFTPKYDYTQTTTIEEFDRVVTVTVGGTSTITTTPGTTTTVTSDFGETVDTVYGTPVIVEEPGDGSNDGTIYIPGTVTSSDATVTDSMGIEIIPPLTDKFYYVVNYTRDPDTSGREYIWVYKIADHTYPELDAVVGGIDTTRVLPIVALRNATVNIDNDLESEEYITSKKLLKKIGLNLDDYIAQLAANPDIAQVQDAFLSFAPNLYSQTPEMVSYWFHFFGILHLRQNITKAKFTEAYEAPEQIDESTGEVIPPTLPYNMHRVTEERYNGLLSFHYIEKTTVDGVIGPTGTANSVVTVVPPTEDKVDLSYIDFRGQISDTQYEQYRVVGLTLSTAIYDGAKTAANLNTVRLSTDPIERASFVFPMAYALLERTPAQHQEVLLYESLTMTIFALEVVHLEYYETAAFASVLTVISFVIFIFTGYNASGGVAALVQIGKQLLIQFALQYLLSEALKAAGDNESAQAIAIIAYIAASVYFSGGSLDLTNAEDLFKAVQVFNKAYTTKLTQEQDLLYKEMQDFDLEAKAIEERIQEAKDMLSTDGMINPLDLITVYNNDPYEVPEDFYARTIHTGNPGVISLEHARTYIDRALQLPELDEYSTQ